MMLSLLHGRMLLLALALFLVSLCSVTRAQAQLPTRPGPCADGHINYAFTAMTMVPNGTGNSGDCNPGRYGGGPAAWTNENLLQIMVVHAGDCGPNGDPWIAELYFDVYGRRPTTSECTRSNYGGGSWASFGDLSNKIRAYQASLAAPPANNVGSAQILHLDRSFDLVDSSGRVVKIASTFKIISQDGNGLTQADLARIVAQGGGNIVSAGAGNIILNGGSTYRVSSTGLPTYILRR